ncbi:MAG: hypothetical protein Q7R54_03115 [bacterium]|nr:hypothetical protein [bacterium]
MKQLLIITAGGIVLIGIGVGVYFTFFANQANVVVAPNDGTSELPVTSTATTTNTGEEANPPVEISQPEKISKRLVQITKDPVVTGAIAYQASSTDPTSDIAVNYLERPSGNIFQYLVHAETLTRISNKTIPGIQEAKWLPSGTLAFVRYLSGDTHTTINTYALPANGPALSGERAGGGYFLAQNIDNLAVSATSLLALASGSNGSVGTLEKPDGSQPKQAFKTPLSSLRTSFLGGNQYLAFTKPSATLAGYAYLVNSTGNFERIAGPLNGLVALGSPSGKWILLSYTSGGILKLSLLNLATRELTPLPVATLADKCVWRADDAAVYCGVPVNPPATFAYPDDWYQGAVAFSDRIWKIDVTGRFAELVLDFRKEAEESLDATALAIDPKGLVLVFKNKNDASLWSYEL